MLKLLKASLPQVVVWLWFSVYSQSIGNLLSLRFLFSSSADSERCSAISLANHDERHVAVLSYVVVELPSSPRWLCTRCTNSRPALSHPCRES